MKYFSFEIVSSNPKVMSKSCIKFPVFSFKFEYDFNTNYNDENDYVDLGEIKQLCSYNMVMKICEYVAEKYQEYGMDVEKSHFEDTNKILKSYIFFYIDDTHKQD